MTEERRLGTVAVLRRYPVKSMLGQELTACDVAREAWPATACWPLSTVRPAR